MKDDFNEEFAYIGSFELNTDLYYGEIDETVIEQEQN